MESVGQPNSDGDWNEFVDLTDRFTVGCQFDVRTLADSEVVPTSGCYGCLVWGRAKTVYFAFSFSPLCPDSVELQTCGQAVS